MFETKVIEVPTYTDLAPYLVLKIPNEEMSNVTSKNMLVSCVKIKTSSSNCKLGDISCN